MKIPSAIERTFRASKPVTTIEQLLLEDDIRSLLVEAVRLVSQYDTVVLISRSNGEISVASAGADDEPDEPTLKEWWELS